MSTRQENIKWVDVSLHAFASDIPNIDPPQSSQRHTIQPQLTYWTFIGNPRFRFPPSGLHTSLPLLR
jgi:hypothetical protein